MPNYQEWINEIDINVDYYSAFLKAWIAFNSWYRSQYKDKQDREIIEKIKANNNQFKDYIETLLDKNATSSIAMEFRDNLDKLQEALTNAAIVTQERGGDRQQISFSEIAITNPKSKSDENYNRTHYMIQRTQDKVSTLIHKKGDTSVVYFQYVQDSYDFSQIEINPDFQKLSPEQQGQCKAFYGQIKPYQTECVIAKNRENVPVFVEERSEVSRGIVEVLYLLRCSLMHGDVHPNKVSSEVYKYAYYVLSAILKKMA
jgi:hypothetical protein